MCTAVALSTKDHYFGRNLDLEYSYNESVTVAPRNYPFRFRMAGELPSHYAMIGMAYVMDGYPLYYDATNEKGLSIAGLNFPENAYYGPAVAGKDNVSPFEFIPWMLGQCADLVQAGELLKKINLARIDFSETLPLSPLHWIIADRHGAITVEQTREGLKVYDNPVGVLTNNPTFDYHMINLSNYMQLSRGEPENRLSDAFELPRYSRGMGAIGLPGDCSSASRFIRGVFNKLNSISEDSEVASVNQFFHILDSVATPRGSVLFHGRPVITIYSSCCNADRGIYYYTTYENREITGVDMHRENLEGSALVSYPLRKERELYIQN